MNDNFVVLTTQRSGSTWFTELLYNNPEIKAYSEVFLYNPRVNRPWNYLLPKFRFYEFRQHNKGIRPFITIKYLNYLSNEGLKEDRIFGFKLMYNQLLQFPEIFFHLIFRRYKIVHLVRENVLDTLISREINRISKIPHIIEKNKRIKSRKIYLKPDSIISKLVSLDSRIILFRKILKVSCRSIEVNYENLSMNNNFVLNKV